MSMKSPEEYFKEQSFGMEDEPGRDFSQAEKAFLQKYLGMDEKAILKRMGIDAPPEESAAPATPDAPAAPAAPGVPERAAAAQPTAAPGRKTSPPKAEVEIEPDLESQLRQESELQMVSFTLGEQEFTVPITVVQEVIRYQQHTKLPAAPSFLAGIVNLRGRVTPLIRLRRLLGVRTGSDELDKFIVVCRRKGLQMGLMIETVATMYRVTQDRIEWGVESNLGINADFILGLMKSDGERLISIISVDRIVDRVLRS